MEDIYNHVDFTKDDLKYVEESDDDENGKRPLRKPSFLKDYPAIERERTWRLNP